MRVLRWVVRVLGGLVAVVVVLLAVVIARGAWLATAPVHRTPRPLPVASDSALVARGAHLAEVICAGCHSGDHSARLAGGHEDFFGEPGMPPFGRLYAPNLTGGGRLAVYTNDELARAIREGIGREGTPLIVMPSQDYHGLSDHDLAALIAWLRAQPPDSYSPPARRILPFAWFVLGAGIVRNSVQPALTGPVPDVPEAATPGYGRYLATAIGCRDCHGMDYRGGGDPFAPRGGDLVAMVGAHPFEAFDAAVRGGQGSDGRALDPMKMPWASFQHLRDDESRAIYEFLKREPPPRGFDP
jgi:mono/diheme cytochrome c family protein